MNQTPRLFIVGGMDYNLPKALRQRVKVIGHHTQESGKNVKVPSGCDAVLVLKDWCSHPVSEGAKANAEALGVPCVITRHGIGPISESLRRIGMWKETPVNATQPAPVIPSVPPGAEERTPTEPMPSAVASPPPAPLPAPPSSPPLSDEERAEQTIQPFAELVRNAINQLPANLPFTNFDVLIKLEELGHPCKNEGDKHLVQCCLSREVGRNRLSSKGRGIFAREQEVRLPGDKPAKPAERPVRTRRPTSATAEEIMAMAEELKNDAINFAAKVERFTQMAEGLCAKMDKLKELLR